MLWNVFRIVGDCLHLLSKCILIFAIHRNRSAEGVSWITQILYAIVFCTRYINSHILNTDVKWNMFFKLFYITTSLYIIAIMRWPYSRTRERELSWKLGTIALALSLLLSPFGMLIFFKKKEWTSLNWLWSFSEILESVAILPQLLLLRQTTVPTVIDSYYLVALGSYRAFYIFNWIERGMDKNDYPPNGLSVLFGVIQTLFYLDFAWVYYSRQRVKLRNGGIVDADDIRQGWLLRTVFGKPLDRLGRRGGGGGMHASADADEAVGGGLHDSGDDDDLDGLNSEDERAPALGGRPYSGRASKAANKWGSRGISVSADDSSLEHESYFQAERSDGHHNLDASVDPDAKMQDPDDLARVLDDDEDDDEGAPPPVAKDSRGEPSGVRNDEWRE